ncbi:hypothetical protein D3C72_2176520 [compost metagenome]
MIDHAEAVLRHDLIEMGGDRFVWHKAQAQPVGGDDLAPHLAIFHGIGEGGQRIGAVLHIGGAQERIHGRR